MHRGSSKAARGAPPAADTLPLSASSFSLDIEIARAGRSVHHRFEVPAGTLVREAVRRVGLAPEGTAVLIDGHSVPLDQPIVRSVNLVLVPTFSGG